MTQRFQVQEGKIVFSATSNTGTPAVDMTVEGQLQVGNDSLSDGLIQAASGQDLILQTTSGGNILLESNTGSVILNNATWPITAPVRGVFLGASSTNNLEFIPFFLSPVALSDSYTPAELNLRYPDAAPGQFAVGPGSVYQCVGAGLWRNLSGGSGSSLITIKDISVLPYTLSTGDELNTMLRVLSTSSGDINIPNDSTLNFPIGTNILISQSGSGAVTVVPAVGVTLNSPDSATIGAQYGKVTIIKVAANEWDIEGNLLAL